MATNKHAQIRYTILDKCFSNFNRDYTYDDLLDEINTQLYEIGTEGIQLRQLQYDIAHMKSSEGYSIQLNENIKSGKKKIFRYKDKTFSLANNPLNTEDSEQLETTLAILSRYKHREEFNWLEELIPRMQFAFDLVADGDDSIISYQDNQDLVGRDLVGVLFNLIVKKKIIEIEYKPYNKAIETSQIHPYHLKQYNNRWFLFGFNDQYKTISNYPLDRIQSVRETANTIIKSSINWVDYFDDIIGVTKPIDIESQIIKFKFSESRINYVLTKPLHGTQKVDKSDDSSLTIQIEVVPNPELYQLILSFGEDIEVVEPDEVALKIKNKIIKMNSKYNHAD